MRHGETKRVLIDHALALLEEDGLAAVTIRGVARRAGLSHGAPLRHFATLPALLSAVAAQGFAELRSRLERARARAREDGAGASAEIMCLAQQYVAFARERPALFELMFRHDLLEGSGGDLRAHSRPVFALVLEPMSDADAARARALTVDLWTAVHGVAVLASRRALDVMTADAPEALVERQVRAHLAGGAGDHPRAAGDQPAGGR